jgi:hypothetical protein
MGIRRSARSQTLKVSEPSFRNGWTNGTSFSIDWNITIPDNKDSGIPEHKISLGKSLTTANNR